MENWKDIPEYEALYKISNVGNIRRIGKSNIMKIQYGKRGYCVITLSKKGKTKTYSIHVLVAKLFCKGYKKGLGVNHKDGNAHNNNSENLEWTTQKYNVNHSIYVLKRKNGGGRKKVLDTISGRIFESASEAHKEMGFIHCYDHTNTMLRGDANNKTSLIYL